MAAEFSRPSCRVTSSHAAGFDADVGSDEAAAVAEVAGGFAGFGVQGFDHVFQHKAAAAEVAQDFFPAVQVFERSFLAVRAADDRWQGAGAIVGLRQLITPRGPLNLRLQARRALVLADVKAAAAGDAGDLPIDGGNLRHIAGADRMDDDVELSRGQHRQLVHRSFHRPERQPPLPRHLPVELQHGGADIHHGHIRPRRGIKRTMLPSPSRQTEKPLPPNISAKPPEPVDGRQGIGKVFVASGPREALSLADTLVPSAAIVSVNGHGE